MLKKIFLGLLVLILACLLFTYLNINTRHAVYYNYNSLDFYQKLITNYSAEPDCEYLATQTLCFENIIQKSGGYLFAQDFGVALGFLMIKPVKEKKPNDPDAKYIAYYKVFSVLVQQIRPENFWIRTIKGKTAKKIFKAEIAELITGLNKNRLDFLAKVNENDKLELKIELQNVINTLDVKLSELELLR